jgi:VanZ family protein
MKKKSILLLIFLLWISFIFFNSSQTAANSNAISYKVVKVIAAGFERIGFEPITREGFLKLNIIIRKLAHGFQFFIFAIVLRFLLEYVNIKKENIIFYTLLGVIFFAAFDEFHQLFVSGRSPSVIDVIIDFTGGVVGVVLINVLNNLRKIKITLISDN